MKKKEGKKSLSVGITFFKRLWNLGKIVFDRWSLMLFLVNLALGAVFAVTNWGVGVSISTIQYGLVSGQMDVSVNAWLWAVALWIIRSLIYTCQKSIKNFCVYRWRRLLTGDCLESYFKGKNYYDILNLGKGFSNPDQRLQADIDSFCQTFAAIVFEGSFSLVLSFGGIVLLLVKQVHFSVYLVIFAPPLINLYIYRILTPPVTNYVYVVDEKEGEYRMLHTRIREHAESISFYHNQDQEKKNIEKSLFQVLLAQLKLSLYYIPFMAYTFMNERGPQIFIFLWLGFLIFQHIPPFYKGMDGSQLQLEGMELFIYAQNVTDQWYRVFMLADQFSKLSGNTHRVAEFLELCKHIDETIGKAELEEAELEYSLNHDYGSNEDTFTDVDSTGESKNVIAMADVKIVTPKGNTLVEDLSFSVFPGISLLIVGTSGIGKSSILRVLSGLWPHKRGKIFKPGPDTVMFLPQVPYLIEGTLRDQIMYPDLEPKSTFFDSDFVAILRKVNLEFLASTYGFDRVYKWDQILSVGESQRLNFARVFYHRPDFLVSDESCSALDVHHLQLILSQVKEMGITLVSIAHRPIVKKYHDRLLLIKPDGKWKLSSIDHSIKENKGTPKYRVIRKVEGARTFFAKPKAKKDQFHGTGLNLTLLKRFVLIFRNMFTCSTRQSTLRQTLLLVTQWLLIGLSFVLFLIPSIAMAPIVTMYGNIVQALFSKEQDLFFRWCVILLATVIIYSSLRGVILFSASLLGLFWRYNLTNKCHDLYFSKNTFYKMIVLDKEVKNPDQRIQSDLKDLTSGFQNEPGFASLYFQSVSYLSLFFVGLLLITYIVHSVAGMMIVVVLYCYSAIHLVLMRKVSRFQFTQDTKEGAFRYSLARLNEHAEQVALVRGKEREKEIIRNKFVKVLSNFKWLLAYQAALDSFAKFFEEANGVINFGILIFCLQFGLFHWTGGPGEKAGLIQQTQGMLGLTLGGLSQFMNLGSLFGRNFGLVNRLGHFIERAKKLRCKYEGELDVEECPDRIQTVNLDVETPDGNTLLSDVNFVVNTDDHMLIRGNSGTGKSSLLRVLASLWAGHGGKIKRPLHIGRDGIFLLSQKPYLYYGSLAEQITYPLPQHHLNDDHLLKLLLRVNLGYLINRMSETQHWQNVLSPGEQQRLIFARLLFHKPKFAFLDESTSALDLFNESNVYTQCKEEGITCISIGHRETLLPFHPFLFEFDGKGGYQLKETISKFSPLLE